MFTQSANTLTSYTRGNVSSGAEAMVSDALNWWVKIGGWRKRTLCLTDCEVCAITMRLGDYQRR
jgi:hypothetical protein